jgi:uncharacterized membrane protein YesL
VSRAFEDWLNVSWVLIPIIGLLIFAGAFATIAYFSIMGAKAIAKRKK